MDPNAPAPAASNPVNVEKRIGQFVALRDMKSEIKKRHEEELKPVNDTLEMIKDELRQALNQVNGDGIKTAAGTASLTTKVSASAADINAFWAWVVTQGAFDMLDKKPNVTAITEYVNIHGVPPPGVNYNTFFDVNVRRK